MRRIYIALVCLVLATSVFAETFTLEKALEIAKENSLSLYTAERSLETAVREYQNRMNSFYPTITASASLTRSNTKTEWDSLVPTSATGSGTYDEVYYYSGDYRETLSTALSASLTLNPAIGDGIKYLKVAAASSGLSKEQAEKALERDVKVSFHNLLYMEGSIQLTRDSLNTLKDEYELALADYRNGRISELELLNTQVAYKNMEPTLASQITSYKELRNNFFLLLGIDPDPELELIGEIELPENVDDLVSITPDLSNNFDIASIDYTIAETELNRDSEVHQGFYPSLTLSASYAPGLTDPFESDTWDEGFLDGDTWSDSGSIGLTISLPLDGWLPGSSTRNSIKSIETSLDVLSKEKAETFRNAAAETNLLIDTMKDSLLNIESLELNERVAKRTYELTEEGYRNGTQEFLALEEAEDDWNTAKQNLLAEKLDFLTSLFDLEYELNTKLTADSAE